MGINVRNVNSLITTLVIWTHHSFKLLLTLGRWVVGGAPPGRVTLLGGSCVMVVEMKFVANEVSLVAFNVFNEFLIYV